MLAETCDGIPSDRPARGSSSRATMIRSQEYMGSTDSHGRFRLEALPAERTEFVVESDDLGRASTSIELAEGIEATWEARTVRGIDRVRPRRRCAGTGSRAVVCERPVRGRSSIRDDEVKWLGWRADCRSGSDGRRCS
jgi:hypothetical protein